MAQDILPSLKGLNKKKAKNVEEDLLYCLNQVRNAVVYLNEFNNGTEEAWAIQAGLCYTCEKLKSILYMPIEKQLQ